MDGVSWMPSDGAAGFAVPVGPRVQRQVSALGELLGLIRWRKRSFIYRRNARLNGLCFHRLRRHIYFDRIAGIHTRFTAKKESIHPIHHEPEISTKTSGNTRYNTCACSDCPRAARILFVDVGLWLGMHTKHAIPSVRIFVDLQNTGPWGFFRGLIHRIRVVGLFVKPCFLGWFIVSRHCQRASGHIVRIG